MECSRWSRGRHPCETDERSEGTTVLLSPLLQLMSQDKRTDATTRDTGVARRHQPHCALPSLCQRLTGAGSVLSVVNSRDASTHSLSQGSQLAFLFSRQTVIYFIASASQQQEHVSPASRASWMPRRRPFESSPSPAASLAPPSVLSKVDAIHLLQASTRVRSLADVILSLGVRVCPHETRSGSKGDQRNSSP